MQQKITILSNIYKIKYKKNLKEKYLTFKGIWHGIDEQERIIFVDLNTNPSQGMPFRKVTHSQDANWCRKNFAYIETEKHFTGYELIILYAELIFENGKFVMIYEDNK